MPSRNTVKNYLENGYYHIYNRGVEKRFIFQDKQDYGVFLGYLREYLLPKDIESLQNQLGNPGTPWAEKDKILKLLRLNNFFDEVKLLAHCLMPNHFHFLVKQNNLSSIDSFMQSLGTRYTMYFNKKYKRVGSLFQGVYKAVNVSTDEQLLHLTRYIHKQAILLQGETLRTIAQPSSYPEYINSRKSEWIFPNEVLSFFSQSVPNLSYENFVLQQDYSPTIADLLIENDDS